MAEAVVCPMPRNSVKESNFSESSVAVNACLVITSMKASGFLDARSAASPRIRLMSNARPDTVRIG